MKRLVIFLLLFIVPFTACVGGESGEEQYFAVRTDYSNGYVTIYNDSNFDWRGVTVTINEDYSYTFGSVNEGDDRRINVSLFKTKLGVSFDYDNEDPFGYSFVIENPALKAEIPITFAPLAVNVQKNDSINMLTITNENNYLWKEIEFTVLFHLYQHNSEYKNGILSITTDTAEYTYKHYYPSIIRSGETVQIPYSSFSLIEKLVAKTISIKITDSKGTIKTWSGSWN